KAAQLQRGVLADPGAAVESYRSILDLDDEEPAALRALDELYTGAARWHDLAELLTRQLDKAGGAARSALKLRLGHLYEEKLEDLTAAIDAYEEVIGADPENRDALGALERLVLHHDVRFR